MMSSLLALVCSFTACNTDIADRYPTIKLEVAAGAVAANSVTFTVTAEGADEIYYWVEKASEVTAEGVEDVVNRLLIEKGTYLDAQTDLPFTQEVVESGLAQTTEYTVYVYAKNFAHHAFATPVSMTTSEAVVITPPTVAVEVDEELVESEGFVAAVVTSNAQKGAWTVVPKYTEGVTAAKVLAEGTALEAAELNDAVEIVVEGLEAGKEYDFYVAVENQGVQVLSDVVAVTTAAPSAPVIEFYFGEASLQQSLDLSAAVGLPGVYVTLMDEGTGCVAQLFMYDLSTYPEYPGYMMSGDYPALTGSFDNGEFPQSSCLLADPGYTQFVNMLTGDTYTVVGNLGVDEDDTVYGVNLISMMPDSDMNMLVFNVPVVDANGNPAVIQGQYTGPLGYSVTPKTYPFDLEGWSFTDFTLKQDGDVVTLKSTSINGDFVMVLNTNGGKWAYSEGEQAIPFVVGENLAGGYYSYVEGPEEFLFTSGRIAFEKIDDAGNYKLYVSTGRGDVSVPGWIMEGKSGAYEIAAPENGYSITVTAAAAE